MAQTGLILVPSDALGHTWALPGVLGAGQGLPPPTGPKNLNDRTQELQVLQVFFLSFKVLRAPLGRQTLAGP